MKTDAFIQKLFERAEAEKMEAYEAFYTTGEQFDVSVNGGEIIDYTVSSSLGLGFRALIGGKMGYASTQVLDEDAIELLIDGVKTNAQLIEDMDEQFIFEGSEEYASLDAFNPDIETMSAAEKIEMARSLEKLAISMDPRATQVDNCSLVSISGEKRIVNSKGLDVSFRDNAFGFGIYLNAREGETVNSGGSFDFSRNPNELSIEKTAQKAVQEAVDGLSAKPVPSGSYRVALRNDVAASLINCFSSVFSADMAQKGLSLLKGREGDAIASDAVTIFDDPTSMASTAFASTPFDGEGVATRKRVIVENGKLVTLLHNLKTARKQGVESTANASRPSYSSPVSVSPSNFYIQPSDTALEGLLEKMGDGLFLTDVTGLHSGANQISGDFSLGAKGYRVENGKIAGAVNQITVAGNFFELLQRVEMVASDLKFGMPSAACAGSPAILVQSLSIAGQ